MKQTSRYPLVLFVFSSLVTIGFVGQSKVAGQDKSESVKRTYSQSGQLIEESSEYDVDNDGSVDGIQTRKFTYDKRGRLIKKVQNWGKAPVETTDLTYKKNTHSLIQERLRRDVDGNGSTEQEIVTTFRYMSGKLVGKTVDVLSEQGDLPVERDNYDFEFLDDGKIAKETKVSVDPATDEAIEKGITLFSYNPKGHMIEKQINQYQANVVVSRETTRFEYDRNGTLIKESTELDSDMDGTSDNTVLTAHSSVNETVRRSSRPWTLLANVLFIIVVAFFWLRSKKNSSTHPNAV